MHIPRDKISVVRTHDIENISVCRHRNLKTNYFNNRTANCYINGYVYMRKLKTLY